MIRRDHHVKEMGIRAIARKHRIHRRLVRQALKSAVPPARKTPVRGSPVFTPDHKAFVDGILIGDQTAPRKQRHTSQRIFIRLVQERGFEGAESTVRRFVAARRRELGRGPDVFVPQSHVAGEIAEVDWFEAQVDFPEGRKKVYFFQMRSCYSGRIFVAAFFRQTQQAFLEAHTLAFRWFGGVFQTIRYDNLTAAVRKVLRGRRRLETDRFVAMRSHYLFESFFCRPGIIGAHEFLADTAVDEWLEELVDKLQLAEPTATAERRRRFEQRFVNRSDPHRSYAAHTDVIEEIVDALLIGRKLVLDYQGRTRADQPLVTPLALIVFRRGMYLMGDVEGGERRRRFAIERIRSAEPAGRFEYPADFDPHAELADNYGIFSPEYPVQDVRLRFIPALADVVRARQYHRSQHFEDVEGGGVDLVMRTTGRELVNLVLEYGMTVEVLEPAWLRERVVEQLETALAQYR